MKDNFSDKSDKYAKYRPTYPQEMLDFILSLLDKKDNAWLGIVVLEQVK